MVLRWSLFIVSHPSISLDQKFSFSLSNVQINQKRDIEKMKSISHATCFKENVFPNLYTGEITSSDKTENIFTLVCPIYIEIKFFGQLTYWSIQIIMKCVQYVILRNKSHLVGINLFGTPCNMPGLSVRGRTRVQGAKPLAGDLPRGRAPDVGVGGCCFLQHLVCLKTIIINN